MSKWPLAEKDFPPLKELSVGLRCGWQRLTYLNHLLLPPRVCSGWKQEDRAELGLAQHSNMGYRHQKPWPGYCTATHPILTPGMGLSAPENYLATSINV